MICKKCGNVITHNSYFDAYYCPRCGEFIREKPPMTNADRIRSMTDDELNEMFHEIYNAGAFEWDDIPPTREEFVRFLKKQPIIDAVLVVRCEKCVLHGNCVTEDAFVLAGIENPFCCAGKRKEGTE